MRGFFRAGMRNPLSSPNRKSDKPVMNNNVCTGAA
jgi:hypothetical protein